MEQRRKYFKETVKFQSEYFPIGSEPEGYISYRELLNVRKSKFFRRNSIGVRSDFCLIDSISGNAIHDSILLSIEVSNRHSDSIIEKYSPYTVSIYCEYVYETGEIVPLDFNKNCYTMSHSDIQQYCWNLFKKIKSDCHKMTASELEKYLLSISEGDQKF